MKNAYIIFLFISLSVATITYLAMDNIFIALGMLVIYVVVSFLLIIPLLKKYEITKNKYYECYHFINNFIISLSIKKSISGALETTVGSMPGDFVDMMQSLENMSENKKLEYLSTYFEFHDYQLFLQVIMLWEETGGDIIEMSKYLISNVRNNEEYITQADSLSRRKYMEIGILWAISLAIVVALRFALKDFFPHIKSQLLYIISISLVMVFVLFSTYLMVKKGTYLNLKGNSTYEKDA